MAIVSSASTYLELNRSHHEHRTWFSSIKSHKWSAYTIYLWSCRTIGNIFTRLSTRPPNIQLYSNLFSHWLFADCRVVLCDAFLPRRQTRAASSLPPGFYAIVGFQKRRFHTTQTWDCLSKALSTPLCNHTDMRKFSSYVCFPHLRKGWTDVDETSKSK